MPKVSPLLKSFNAGEWSDLVSARVDIDRYTSSMKRLRDTIAVVQGPAIARSGTAMKVPIRDETKNAIQIPFTYRDDQAVILEISPGMMRIVNDDGLLVRAPVAVTAVSSNAGNLRVTAAGHGASVDEYVALDGFPATSNLNGEIVKVTVVAGNDVTFDIAFPAGLTFSGAPTISRVYELELPYTTGTELFSLRYAESNEVIYLYCPGQRNYKLSRNGTYDWSIAEVIYTDGPYLPTNDTSTRLSWDVRGSAVPIMTDNTTPSGTASATTNDADAFKAFDGDLNTAWQSADDQKGEIAFEFAAPHVVTGYTIYVPSDNATTQGGVSGSAAADHNALGFAPYTWTFEGFDGTDWIVLDSQIGFDAWTDFRSIYLPFKNETPIEKVKLVITAARDAGAVKPKIGLLTVYADDATADLTITATATAGINNGLGFLLTDVDRLVRVRAEDGFWRDIRITARTSTTIVTGRLQGDPFPTLKNSHRWRLGYWSDTTGWPTLASFGIGDRLYVGGVAGYPNVVVGSVVGLYEKFRQTEPDDTVVDDNAIIATLQYRKFPIVSWLEDDERGLLIGTTSSEWVLGPKNPNEGFSARNILARRSSRRGAARIEPAAIDKQILYVQRAQRTLRELVYVFEADGYKSPSMSTFATHLGSSEFRQLAYAAEPHSIVWIRRADGKLAHLAYNRDENVIGWGLNELPGGFIEHMAVIPDPDLKQDALWLIVKRETPSGTRRFHEKLMPLWDFGNVKEDAWFVDCGLRYDGVPTETLYGLTIYNGMEVYGLADGAPIGPYTIAGGTLALPFVASKVVIGFGYESLGEVSNIEAGSATGTAQTKTVRVNEMHVRLWESGPGMIGKTEELLAAIDMREPNSFLDQALPLFSGDFGPIAWEPGYDRAATVVFKKPKGCTLPFNVVGLMPRMEVQDG